MEARSCGGKWWSVGVSESEGGGEWESGRVGAGLSRPVPGGPGGASVHAHVHVHVHLHLP
jgi:hypothetical protein